MDQNEVINIVRKYSETLSQSLLFDAVYLFGSYARGNPRTHSDIDVAIMINKFEGEYMDIVLHLWKVSSKVDVRIEPVLILPNEDPSGFSKEIIRSGIRIN